MAFYNNVIAGSAGAAAAGGGDSSSAYKIQRSLRFNSDDSTSLSSDITATTTFSISFWYKHVSLSRSDILVTDSGTGFFFYQHTDGSFRLNNNTSNLFISNGLYNDPTAWYHCLITNNGTTFTLYVNGVLDKAETVSAALSAGNIFIGRDRTNTSNANYGDFYIAEFNFIEGSVLSTTDVGQFDSNGIWSPKRYTGGYTTSTPTQTTLSQTGWNPSTTASGNHTYIWDGNTSNKAWGYAGNSIGTVTFNPPLTNVTKVELWTQDYTHYLNGNTITTSETVNGGWHTYYDDSSNPITLTSVGNAYNSTQTVDLAAIRINDSIIDSQTWTPPSGVGLQAPAQKSFYLKFDPNASGAVTHSSDFVSQTGAYYQNQRPPSRAFDGNLSTTCDTENANNWLEWTPTGGYAYTSKVEVYTAQTSGTYSFNGGTAAALSNPNNGWNTVATGSGTITSVKIFGDGSNWGAVAAFRVDDKIVVDQEALGLDSSGNGNVFFVSNLVAGPGVHYEDDVNVQIDGSIDNATSEPHKMFNGSSVDYAYASSNNSANYILWEPTGGFTTPGYIWIQGGDGNGNGLDTCTVDINGSTVTSSANVNNTNYSSSSYGWGRWWKYPVSGNTLTSLKVTKEYALLRSLSIVEDPTWATLGISSDENVPTINSVAGKDVDSVIDSPSNYDATPSNGGNYCTLSPIDRQSTNGTLANGNLDLQQTSGAWAMYRGTMHVSSGKWYWEVTLGNAQYSIFGIIPSDYQMSSSTNYWIAQVPGAYCFYPYTGNKYDNTTSSSYATADTNGTGDVYGMALDLDAGTMTYYKNGTSLGTAFTGISGSFAPAAGLYNQTGFDSYNFGQHKFRHAIPSGYQTLCTANLTDPTIMDGSTAFDVVLYSGNADKIQVGGGTPSANATVVGGTLSNAGNAFNGASSDWATLAATDTNTAAHVDFALPASLTGITRIQAAFDSPSGSGDTRGRYNGSNAGATRTGTGSGWSDIYSGSAITVTSLGFAINQNGQTGTSSDIVSRFKVTDQHGTYQVVDQTQDGLKFTPEMVWIKARAGTNKAYNHRLYDAVRGPFAELYPSTNDEEVNASTGLRRFSDSGFRLGASVGLNGASTTYVAWCWDAGSVPLNEVGSYWNPSYATKYIGFKFDSDRGGRAVFGLTSGTGTADIYTSTDNSSWTRVQQNVTLSTTDTTYDSSDRYLIVVNTENAQWGATHYAMATNGTDAHYSTATYPGDGASFTWSGPTYTDWDFRSSGTVNKPGSANSSAYNQSQHWSNNYTGNNGAAPTPAFNGQGPVQNGYAHSGSALTLNFSPALSGRIIVYGGKGGSTADDFTISDGTNTTTLSSDQTYASAPYWDELDFGEQTGITSLTCSAGYTLYGVRVAGKLLVDSNVTPPNVPSIASTTRASAEHGFSIVQYHGSNGTGESIAHNLGKKPDFIIVKRTANTTGWEIYHSAVGATKYGKINATLAWPDDDSRWYDKEPDSNVFTVGGSSTVIGDGQITLALCWTEIEGFSKFGKFSGNGTNDNVYVHCGFKPKLIMYSYFTHTGDWMIQDTSRRPGGNAGGTLTGTNERGEDDWYSSTQANLDFLSNGFKIRHNGSPGGDSGREVVFCAWAENPFKIARAGGNS